jgi:hypothetical protein
MLDYDEGRQNSVFNSNYYIFYYVISSLSLS